MLRSCICLLLSVCSLFAQSNFGTIQGQVTDGSGAAVPGAKVVITDAGTNQAFTIMTNDRGLYSSPPLRPVTYDITVESAGFQKTVAKGVKVDTAGNTTVNVSLKPGEIQQTVDVSDEVPLLQTVSGALTQTVDQKTIIDTPLNGRNTLQLALILPGATGSAGTEISEFNTNEPLPGRELTINGGRMGSTQFLADGANVTSIGLSRMSISFTPDTIQEFSVQQANFSAQFAQAGGAIIQQTTKSGTNRYQGTAYWFHRQKAFTANPFAANRLPLFGNDSRAPLRRQQLGATFGGPVWIPKVYKGKDRTFFFVSYEPTRQLASSTGGPTFSRIPTERELNGDFSQSLVYFRNAQTGAIRTEPYALLYRQFERQANGTLAYINNPGFNPALPISGTNSRFLFGGFELFNPSDPDPARRGRVLVDALGRSYVNPVAQRIARELYPAPNIPFGASQDNPGANFAFFRKTEFEDDRYTVRLDHRLTEKHQIFGRYTFQPQFGSRFQRDPFQAGLISDKNQSRQITTTLTSTFNASTVNELRLNYVYGNFGRNFPEAIIDRDWTSEFLKLGGAGDGSPNILGYGMARFWNNAAPTGVSGQQSGSPFDALGFLQPQDVGKNVEHRYGITDDYSIIKGNLTMKLGFSGNLLMLNQGNLGIGSLGGGRYDFGRGQTNQTNCSSNPLPVTIPGCTNDPFGGDPFASYLLGVPSGLQVQTENLSNSYYYRWMTWGAYMQNDWRVRRNLTLNIGLRYQYQSPRWEKNNFQGVLNLQRLEPNPFRNNLPAPVFEFAGFEGRSRYLVNPQKLDFEPRFGFAWTPDFGKSKLVVRGGYGITHAQLMGDDREPLPNIGSQTFGGYRSISYLLGTNDYLPPTNTATCGLAICDPRIPMQFGFNNAVLAQDPTMFIIPPGGAIRPGDLAATRATRPGEAIQDLRYQATGVVGFPNFRTPRIHNYSFLLEYEFMRNTVLRTGYQGSRGTRLFGVPFNINREDPFTGALPYPGFQGRANASIFVIHPTNSDSWYNAYTVEVERRYYQGLQFRFNYTWSKALDNTSGGISFPIPNNSFNNATGDIPFLRNQNPYDLNLEKSVAPTNQPHVFNTVAFWDVPVGQGKKFMNRGGWLHHILGDWQMSGLSRIRSGFPISTALGGTNSLDLGTPGGGFRPDLIPGVPLRNPDWTNENALFTPYINPRAFAWPEPGQFGNAARYFSVNLPWVRTFDASLIKRIRPWKESRRQLELRVEAFNVLNVRNYEGAGQTLFAGGAQNPLLLGAQGARTVNPNVQNRFGNLRAPGVWDAIIAKSFGTPVDDAIANLPGPGGTRGCPANAAELAPANTNGALSPACVARSLNLNGGFGRLGINNQQLQPRIIQFALRLYF